MPETYPEPALDDVRDAVARCFPPLPAETLYRLSHGWDFIAYVCGDYIVKLPRHGGARDRIPVETRLLAALAPRLPVAIPVIDLHCDDGPAGRPLLAYRLVPGTPLSSLGPGERPRLARGLGVFLRALHDVPPDVAIEAGLAAADTASWRRDIETAYENARRVAFPLLSAEAQRWGESVFESFLSDTANFRFTPAVLHFDLWEDHALVDATGALSGVIDFGDARIGDPAADFIWQCADTPLTNRDSFAALTGTNSLAEHLAAYGGVTDAFVARARAYEAQRLFDDISGCVEANHPQLALSIKEVEDRAKSAA